MSEELPASERIIDREAETEQFLAVLSRASEPRLITLEAATGAGKSLLLELLEELSADADPPALAVRARLVEDADLIWLVEELGKTFAASGVPLRRFERFNRARRTFDHNAFGLPPPPQPPSLNVKVEDSVLHGSRVTGLSGWGGWPEGYEQAAQEKCLEVLLDDVRDLCEQRTVVLLLDQYERRTERVQVWLSTVLLSRIFEPSGGFGALVFVVASKSVAFPKLANHLGSRSADLLCPMTLSQWADEHIDEWLERVGLDRETWAPPVRDMLERGSSLQDLMMLAGVAGHKA